MTRAHEEFDEMFPEWRFCGDGCPWCPIREPISIRPVFGEVAEEDGFNFLYRCQAGHDWWTWYSTEMAESLAERSIKQKVRFFPASPEFPNL